MNIRIVTNCTPCGLTARSMTGINQTLRVGPAIKSQGIKFFVELAGQFLKIFFLGLILSCSVFAQDAQLEIKNLVDEHLMKIVQNQHLIETVKHQNTLSLERSPQDLRHLDKLWELEISGTERALIDEILTHPASQFLNSIKYASNGKITQIYVTDIKGLNVAQSDLTSHYWQGHFPQWQKTSGLSHPREIVMGQIQTSPITHMREQLISLPLMDQQTGALIGVICATIDLGA